MDKRLLEFCVSVPPEQKLDQGWTRLVMRNAMADVLPTDIQWRRHKITPNALFIAGLQQFDLPLLEAVLRQSGDLLEPYLAQTELPLKHLQAWLDGDITELSPNAWNALTLMMWLSNRDGSAPLRQQIAEVCKAHTLTR
ncbi:MAG: hypothetical protein HC824_12320 [Synechococcales cyanobacterium RM1_1_8]|nr:hypothetical protein [Synechococcales cyanobacterium RM1_1_8]